MEEKSDFHVSKRELPYVLNIYLYVFGEEASLHVEGRTRLSILGKASLRWGWTTIVGVSRKKISLYSGEISSLQAEVCSSLCLQIYLCVLREQLSFIIASLWLQI